MNPETFIQDNISRGLNVDHILMEKIVSPYIVKYRRNEFNFISDLIFEARDELKKSIILSDWATVKDIMKFTESSEYKIRKYLQEAIEKEKIKVDRTNRPYVYKEI